MRALKFLIFLLSFVVFLPSIHAQFYNGTQMGFGKNRVQYKDSFWQYLRYQDFDVYYDKEGRELADFTAQNVPLIISEIESILEVEYPRRIIFIVCNSLQDFKQTNIGLSTSDQDYNIGGVTQIVDNKVIIYFTGDHNELLRQIRKGVAQLLIYESIYGVDNYKEIISNSTNTQYPTWFVQGLIEYLAENWDEKTAAKVYQGIASETYKKLVQLQGDDAVVAGHALWKYVAEQYGEKSIGAILYISGVTSELDASFYFVVGKDVSELISEMEYYYSARMGGGDYKPITGTVIRIPKRNAKKNIISFSVQPTKQKIAYVTECSGQLRLWIQNIDGSNKKQLAKFGHKIEQISDNSFPAIAWHPTGKIISYFFEAEGRLFFCNYYIETKEYKIREFHNFEKVLSFNYSNDGFRIVFSGVKNGVTDVYTYDVRTYATKQITSDNADDQTPVFISNDSKILFSSNRVQLNTELLQDSIRKEYDLYIKDVDSPQETVQCIQKTKFDNEQYPIELSEGKYLFLSNKSGVINLYYTKPDSTISYIDTIVHYNYFSESFPLTNYTENIINYNYVTNSDQIYLQSLHKNKIQFQQVSLDGLFENRVSEQQNTYFKQIEDSILNAQESKHIVSNKYMNPSNSSNLIDFNNYMFEYELYPTNKYIDSVLVHDSINAKYKSARPYQTNFYVNQVVNQVDFGFVSSSYQKFTGSEFYYIPRLNVFLKFGVIDLFEDYRLTGGVRLFGDFNSSEYLVSIENLKKRWDKQYIFHRQSLTTYSDYTTYNMNKTFDNLLLGIYKYPFDEVKSFRISPSFRFVKDVELSTGNVASLKEESKLEYWSSIKLEYVFDNIIPKGLNVYNGTRFKAFMEYYEAINKTPSYLFVLGLDYRHYQKIHRNIILASRFAYSYSQGSSPLLYYLGSVDNWINLSLNKSKYNTSIDYDKTQTWAYQALATNLRGFQQNIRNGPSFAVLNNELRFPIVQYFAKKPKRSDVFANLQLIGFFDAGAAWYGAYPGAKENAYKYRVINGSGKSRVIVKIDEMHQPFVYGYGYGLRTKLFGYFLRADWAFGNDEGEVTKMFYLSLSLDF